MYWLLVAVIMGIVEGLTEFIPVSSTGHLIVTGNILGFVGDKAATFEVVIQLGAILAVAIIYRKKLVHMLHPNNILDFKKSELNILHIALGIIPAVIIGYLFHEPIKEYLFSPFTVILGLILGSLLMIWAEDFAMPIKKKDIVITIFSVLTIFLMFYIYITEHLISSFIITTALISGLILLIFMLLIFFANKFSKTININTMDKISLKQAFIIGLVQCLSLWPGFSRAGATISGGMFSGLNRKTATEFSFIIAIPLMFGVSIFEMYKMWEVLNISDLTILLVGFITSFIVAYIAVLFFLKLVQKYTLKVFAYYRFIIAAISALIYFSI